MSGKPAVTPTDERTARIAKAATLDEVFDILGVASTSPEAAAVEAVWLALRPIDKL